MNDIVITIIDRNKTTHKISAPTDMNLNLMEICKLNDLPVAGECGGMAMCATCQVYVLSSHNINEPSEQELAMLDQAFFVKENSRLGCQIYLQNNLDGLVVELAPDNDL